MGLEQVMRITSVSTYDTYCSAEHAMELPMYCMYLQCLLVALLISWRVLYPEVKYNNTTYSSTRHAHCATMTHAVKVIVSSFQIV